MTRRRRISEAEKARRRAQAVGLGAPSPEELSSTVREWVRENPLPPEFRPHRSFLFPRLLLLAADPKPGDTNE